MSRAELERAIRDHGGNLTRAAGALRVSRPTLYKHVWREGLQGLAGLSNGQGAPLPDDARRPRTVQLPEGLWLWARMHALGGRRTASDVVEQALEELRARSDSGA